MPLTIPNSIRLASALALTLWMAAATAQKYTPEPPPLTVAPCKPTKKDPCPPAADTTPTPATPANSFPFPGESAQDAPDATRPPTQNAPAGMPDTPAPTTQGAIPFPGEPSPTAPMPANQSAFPFPGEPAAELPGSSSSSSSSSSAPDADPDHPALKDEGSTGSTRFSRKKLPKVTVVDPDERESRDLEVSHYYFTTGNFQAAYLRARDAATTIPDDPAAHLALAGAAMRLNKPDEAVAEYNACLKLDATDPQAKEARKGLAELAAAKPIKQAAR